jgi:perosamine synthetase
VSVPHCTAALHLALGALDIGPGDEVIVPDVTWIASVAPVFYVGAEPVLVDILPDTWCIDPAAVEAAIGPRTKARTDGMRLCDSFMCAADEAKVRLCEFW